MAKHNRAQLDPIYEYDHTAPTSSDPVSPQQFYTYTSNHAPRTQSQSCKLQSDLTTYFQDLSDDEANYSLPEKDFATITPPVWVRRLSTSASRCWFPRRLQRYLLAILLLSLGCYFTWLRRTAPDRAYQTKLDGSLRLEFAQGRTFGHNVPPIFADMIHIQQLDPKWLPSTHGKEQKHRRLIFVGDVHGCLEELKDLLDKVDFDRNTDHLILTGDMIAKGPDSGGVVDYISGLGASCVRGNHEDRVLLAHASLHRKHVPTHKSSEHAPDSEDETITAESHNTGDDKAKKLAKQLTDTQVSFLQQCPVILRVGTIDPSHGEIVVVHGGLVPGVAYDKQDPFQVMNMRTIDLDTRMPSELRVGEPWDQVWGHFQKKVHPKEDRVTVVYGHDAKRGLQINKYSKGLDSNCVRGGRLTALVVDAHGKEKLHHVKCRDEEGYDIKKKKGKH